MHGKFFAHFANNTLFLAGTLRFEFPRIPPPPVESWPEVETLSFGFPRIPLLPPPHGKLARRWEVGSLNFGYPRIPPTPKMKSWPEVGTLGTQEYPPPNSWSVWRLTAVSPKDTVLFSFVFAEPLVCGKLYVYVTVPLGLWMIRRTRRFITEPQQVDFNILY